eukprot:8916250-Pyramimonas_sp.AAC.1
MSSSVSKRNRCFAARHPSRVARQQFRVTRQRSPQPYRVTASHRERQPSNHKTDHGVSMQCEHDGDVNSDVGRL